MRRAQVQTISVVLIAGIILALAGAAYFWGRPLIEKRTTISDVSTAESFMLELDKRIVEVARNGGSKTVSIPGVSGSSILVNETGNEIVYTLHATQSMLGLGEESAPIPVETYDMRTVGQYGSSPRIITLEGKEIDNNQYEMTIRLKYRELDTEDMGYKIVLVDGGKTGSSAIGAKFIGTSTSAGPAANGGDLIITQINVTVS